MTTFSGTYRFWEGVQNDPAIAGAWGTPNSENMALVEEAFGGTGSLVLIPVAGLSTINLSTANGADDQSRPLIQQYTGALLTDCTVNLPNVQRNLGFAINTTTGQHNIILSAGAGTKVTIPADSSLYWYRVDGAGNVNSWDIAFAGKIKTGTANVSSVLLSPVGNAIFNSAVGNGFNFCQFQQSGTVLGSISNHLGTGVLYNIASDATLKTHEREIGGAEAVRVVMALVPRWFRWKADPKSPAEPGFFAQQVVRWWPWAVTRGRSRIGRKDWLPWQIDNSKLVPLLTAALQDALRRIDALEKGR